MIKIAEEGTKIPVVVTPEYTLYLDKFKDLLFIHCTVRVWNKKTKKDLEVALAYMLDSYKQPFYATHELDDNKHRKFLEMYGFEYFSTEPCLDGLDRQVWIKHYEGNK